MKKIVSLLLAVVMSVTCFTTVAYADGDHKINNAKSIMERVENENYNVLKLRESTIDTDGNKTLRKATQLPGKYSLADTLPTVRDQGDTGTCWSFASIASMESNMIKKGLADKSVNLSEYHLAWFTYNGDNDNIRSQYAGDDTYNAGRPYDNGGNAYMASSTLARWYGAVNDSVASTPKRLDPSLRTQSRVHLEDVVWLTLPSNERERSVIKEYIMNNGAIVMGYCHHDRCYDEETLIHNCKHGSRAINYQDAGYHDVAVAGWDDSKGAWLIRNSWGRNWGDNGYFYIDYDDTTIMDMFGFQVGKKLKETQYIYQYDGVGFGDNLYISTTNFLAANRFVARTDMKLDAVGTYAPADNSKIYVRVYLRPNQKSPVTGTKIYEYMYNVKEAGYHTLEIGKDIYIPKGFGYSIVTRTTFDYDGQKCYLIPNEVKAINYDFSDIEYGNNQSYIYDSGKWYDVEDVDNIFDDYDGEEYEIGNALIKGHGTVTGKTNQRISVTTSYKKVNGSKAFNLNAKLTTGNGKLYYKSSDTSVATVSKDGLVTVKKTGKATITVTAGPTSKYASASKKVSVAVTPPKEKITSVTSPASGKVKVTWKKFPNANGYQVQAALDKDFTKDKRSIVLKGSSNTGRTITGMLRGKTYYVRVRAYKTVDGSKIYGSFSDIKSVVIK